MSISFAEIDAIINKALSVNGLEIKDGQIMLKSGENASSATVGNFFANIKSQLLAYDLKVIAREHSKALANIVSEQNMMSNEIINKHKAALEKEYKSQNADFNL